MHTYTKGSGLKNTNTVLCDYYWAFLKLRDTI